MASEHASMVFSKAGFVVGDARGALAPSSRHAAHAAGLGPVIGSSSSQDGAGKTPAVEAGDQDLSIQQRRTAGLSRGTPSRMKRSSRISMVAMTPSTRSENSTRRMRPRYSWRIGHGDRVRRRLW